MFTATLQVSFIYIILLCFGLLCRCSVFNHSATTMQPEKHSNSSNNSSSSSNSQGDEQRKILVRRQTRDLNLMPPEQSCFSSLIASPVISWVMSRRCFGSSTEWLLTGPHRDWWFLYHTTSNFVTGKKPLTFTLEFRSVRDIALAFKQQLTV